MVFSSLEFIFIFLPVFMIAYSASRKELRDAIIFIGSIAFGIVTYRKLHIHNILPTMLFVMAALAVFVGIYLASQREYRNLIIFAGSVFFYSLGVKEPVYIILFLLSYSIQQRFVFAGKKAE